MKLTSRNLVAFASIAIACLVLFPVGCTRDEEAREAAQQPEPIPPRLEDPAYRQALDERRDAQLEILTVRQRIVEQMQAKFADAKARLGTDDEDAINLELEKDPEWTSLRDRLTDLDTALGDERRRAAAVVRGRIRADLEKGKGGAQ